MDEMFGFPGAGAARPPAGPEDDTQVCGADLMDSIAEEYMRTNGMVNLEEELAPTPGKPAIVGVAIRGCLCM